MDAASVVSGGAVVAEEAVVLEGDIGGWAETESVASDGTMDLEEAGREEEDVEDAKEVEGEALHAAPPSDAPAVAEATEATATASQQPPTLEAAPPAASTASSSSSSDSSSSSSSSDSSDSSSDSEVEDVTDQYKSAAPASSADAAAALRTMSESEDDEVDTEQWFQEHDLETDGMEIVGVVEAQPQDVVAGVDDDVDVFLLSQDAFKAELERGSAVKRRRQNEPGETAEIHDDCGGEETTSSSDPDQSEDEFGRRRKAASWKRTTKKSRDVHGSTKKKTAGRAASAVSPIAAVSLVVYTSVPARFSIFKNIAPDDSEFPILKGEYEVRGGHRAHFFGQWGFTEAHFARNDTSKFEYSSGYIHDRRDCDERPHSGSYGGYFNLRQFNGKVVKIKEDKIEFHFVRLPPDNDAEKNSQGAAVTYEVFGEGKNRYGRFLVRGFFNATMGRMTVRRRYLE